MIHVGIDVGLKGGVAVVNEAGDVTLCVRYAPEALRRVLLLPSDLGSILPKRNVRVSVEKTQAFPGMGVSGAHNYGVSRGIIEGILVGLDIPYTLVPPRVWQKVMFVGTDVHLTPKRRAWQAAQRIFPNHYQSFLSPRGKVLDGLVDAALIAEYGRRTHG